MTHRTVTTLPPSFPDAPTDQPLAHTDGGVRFEVLCGDRDHWRAGLYSPPETSPREVTELERHDCPELFVLLRGRLVLMLAGPGGPTTTELQPGRPVLVTAPHSGYCPDGPHTGVALVVERDAFTTEYRSVEEWAEALPCRRGEGGIGTGVR